MKNKNKKQTLNLGFNNSHSKAELKLCNPPFNFNFGSQKFTKTQILFTTFFLVVLMLGVVTAYTNTSIMYGENASGSQVPLAVDNDGQLEVNLDLMNITAGDVEVSGNISLGETITFALGSVIDNLVSGWTRFSDNLNVSTGNLTLGGKLLSNDGGTLTWGGLDVRNNVSVLHGVNDSGTPVGLSVDSNRILNMNIVGVASDIWELSGSVVQLVTARDVNISGDLNVTQNLNVQGNITGGSPVKIVGGLDVSGDVNFSNDFDRGCPSGMVKVGTFCIDVYEASLGSGSVGNKNGSDTTAVAASVSGAAPLVSVTWFQAQQACLNAGKRLCTNNEWQGAVAGTPDPDTSDPADDSEECNIWSNSKPSGATWSVENQAILTGTASSCVSRWGTYDMIGNVWEWTADWTTPAATDTDPSSWTEFGDSDQIWNYNTGAYTGSQYTTGAIAAFIRGGAWGNGADAGAFALYLDRAPSSSGTNVGFRCCKS